MKSWVEPFCTTQDIKLRVASKEKAKKANFQTALVEEHISSRYRLSLRVRLYTIN
jgi:hypothetical protein